MTDQQQQPPRQATVADILNDLPQVQQIALRPMARNPLLGLVLEQAEALREIARWAGLCSRVAQDAAPDEATPEGARPADAAGGDEAEAPGAADAAAPGRRGG